MTKYHVHICFGSEITTHNLATVPRIQLHWIEYLTINSNILDPKSVMQVGKAVGRKHDDILAMSLIPTKHAFFYMKMILSPLKHNLY